MQRTLLAADQVCRSELAFKLSLDTTSMKELVYQMCEIHRHEFAAAPRYSGIPKDALPTIAEGSNS